MQSLTRRRLLGNLWFPPPWVGENSTEWTDAWVSGRAYCAHCGNARISSFPNKSPLADFFCPSCREAVRTQEPKGQVRHEGCRWRVQDEMRASGRKQQSKSLPDELRSQVTRGRQSVHCAEALFRPGDHRGTNAAGRS